MQQQKISPWLIAFRILFTAALAACIAYIFHNSLEEAAASSLRSQRVTEVINEGLSKVHMGPVTEHTVRKLAHFAEFTMLGFWLMLCLRVYTRHFVRHCSWPLLGGMTTALADETLQRFIDGRSADVRDVWIDMAGVTAGLFVALLLLLIARLLGFSLRLEKENERLRAENDAYQQREQAEAHRRLAHRAVERARHAQQAQTTPPGGLEEDPTQTPEWGGGSHDRT